MGLLGLGFRQGEDVHLAAGQGGDRVCLVGLVVVDEEGDAGRLHPALPPVGVRAAYGDGALATVRLPGVGGAKGEGAVGQQVLGGKPVVPLAGFKIGLAARHVVGPGGEGGEVWVAFLQADD